MSIEEQPIDSSKMNKQAMAAEKSKVYLASCDIGIKLNSKENSSCKEFQSMKLFETTSHPSERLSKTLIHGYTRSWQRFSSAFSEIMNEMQLIVKFRSTMVKDVGNRLQGIPGATQPRIVNVILQVRKVRNKYPFCFSKGNVMNLEAIFMGLISDFTDPTHGFGAVYSFVLSTTYIL